MPIHRSVLSPVVLSVVLTGACSPSPEAPTTSPPEGAADLVVRGGKIVTLDPTRPEAEAVAIRDGRIVAVGDEADVASLVGDSTRIVEVGDGVAIPGFVEAHGHLLDFGVSRMILDLRDATTWDEVVATVAAAVETSEPGQWIEGRGWHQDKWTALPADAVDGVPVHDLLSAASPENPVLLEHASGHGSFANAAALELSGVDASTPDPEGGTIVRRADGTPTGYLRETAQGLVRAAPPTEADRRRAVELAVEEALRSGVTSFQDAGTDVEGTRLLRKIAAEGGLGLRLWVMIRDSNEAIRAALPGIRAHREADAHFTVGGIKHSIDGALGAHGAWMLEPYSDLPETAGLNTTEIPTIEESARLAVEHDLQLCVHAIGDRANRETLDLFERAAAAVDGGIEGRRWRVEHAQHLHPDEIPRFAELGVVASIQGVHCTSDGPWVPTRIGPQRAEEGAYVWRSLREAGARIANGTDVPVESIDPIANYHSTVTRRMANGEAFYPDQAMQREEALRSMTIDAAWAAFEEDIKGSLEVGKLGDLVVLSRDVLTVPEDEIPGTEVRATIVGGRVLYGG